MLTPPKTRMRKQREEADDLHGIVQTVDALLTEEVRGNQKKPSQRVYQEGTVDVLQQVVMLAKFEKKQKKRSKLAQFEQQQQKRSKQGEQTTGEKQAQVGKPDNQLRLQVENLQKALGAAASNVCRHSCVVHQKAQGGGPIKHGGTLAHLMTIVQYEDQHNKGSNGGGGSKNGELQPQGEEEEEEEKEEKEEEEEKEDEEGTERGGSCPGGRIRSGGAN